MKKYLLVIVALLGMVTQGTWAQYTPFVQYSWNETTNSVEKTIINDKSAFVLPKHDGEWLNLGKAGTVSYYEILGSVTPKVIQIIGEVHLILRNNSTLTVEHIKLEAGNTLHIHQEATDGGTVGKITVRNTTYDNAAGIGSAKGTNCGTLYIHGGDITSTGAEGAAGIGGGYGGSGGTITIYDGTVTANGGMDAAGIGRGEHGEGGAIALYGGEIYANGGSAGFTGISLGSTNTFGHVRVYRGLGPGSYAALHTPSPLRADICARNRYVKIVGCTSHQFICSTCTYCGKQSDTPQTSKYIDRTWDGSKVVETERDIENAINLAEQLTIIPAPDGSSGSCDKGGDITGKTYYVSGELDLTDYTLYDNGQVSNIILCDDAELRVHHILAVGDGGKLHFYGQKGDKGKLIANEAKSHNGRNEMRHPNGYEYGYLAIGCTFNAHAVDLFFHGGDILGYASNETGRGSIGIENGSDGESYMYFYGGKVEGIGIGKYSIGIGGGPARIKIYGGTVIGRGGENSPGIGGQFQLDGAVDPSTTAIEIFGGNVEGYGGADGAGIGGFFQQAGVVDIHGGTVTAVGGDRAAGIGGGNWAASHVKIFGGIVTSTGGKYGAGIGGGKDSHGGFITITGGTVHAYGGMDAAGIGGGEGGNAGYITISGGIVYAESTGEDSNGSGIGAGEDGYGNASIKGGWVYAKGGSGRGAAIGSNLSDKLGQLSLPDAYMVEAGSSENDIERRFTAAERVDACHWRRYAEITPCTHSTPVRGSDKTEATSYTIGNDNTHTMYCRYCNLVTTEAHHFVENICDKCGKTFNANEDTWTVTIHQTSAAALQAQGLYDAGTQYQVLKGQSFNLPEIPEIEGVNMLALVKVTDTQNAPGTVWLTDDEIVNHTNFFDPSQPFTPSENTHFYPRYRFDYTATWTWGKKPNGKVDVNNVQLSLSNPLLDYEQTIYLQSSDITKEEDKDKDDIKYTATYRYQPLAGVTYTFTDVMHDRYYDTVVELYENENNRWTIRDYNGYTTDVTLKGRTFRHNGQWTAVILPFALSAEQLAADDCPLHGASIRQLESCLLADGTLTLNFSDVTATAAGTPYMVKWPKGDDVTDPLFKAVLMSDGINQSEAINYEEQYGVTFLSTYQPFGITEEVMNLKSVLCVGDDGKIGSPTSGTTLGSSYPYFLLAGFTTDDLAQGDESIIVNLGEEDPTGITPVTTLPSASDDTYYDLSGRKVSNGQMPKGIYIQNGKKVVIK